MKITISNIITAALGISVAYLLATQDSSTEVATKGPQNSNALKTQIKNLDEKMRKLEDRVSTLSESSLDYKTEVSELRVDVERAQNAIEALEDRENKISKKYTANTIPDEHKLSEKELTNVIRKKLEKIESSLNLDDKKSRRMKRVADRFLAKLVEVHQTENDHNRLEREKAVLYRKTNREVRKILSPEEYQKYIDAFREVRR